MKEPGLDNRHRDRNGRIDDKRNDTHIGTIEEQYGVKLPFRSDTHLGTAKERVGLEEKDSLNDFLRQMGIKK